MAKKQKSLTISAYRKWTATEYGLRAGKYLAPVVPAGIITAINWDEWFVNCGWSLPFGLATLCVALLYTIIAIAKKDKLANEKLSPIYYIAGGVCIWAISFMFLANVLQQMGQMLLWVACGIVASATCDEVDLLLASPRRQEYKQLIVDNNLSSFTRKEAERKAKADALAKEEAKARAYE